MLPRKHNRYPLQVPVLFSWKDAQEIRHQGIGLTRDISVRGAFVFTASPPPLNTELDFNGFLPRIRGAVQSLRISGRGQVVRVDQVIGGEASKGFAMAGKPFAVKPALTITERAPFVTRNAA